jgi:diguanylate cyclase (GGDEF)-like protein
MNARRFLEGRSQFFWGAVGILLIILLGVLDYITGYEMTISLFYLIPIYLAAWYGSTSLGLFISAMCALALFFADYMSGLVYSRPTIYIWNMLLWVGFFFVVAGLVSALRKTYRVNQELARVDYVTGAVSIRFFYELAKTEIMRSGRYERPFTFAYFDIDNFKTINDTLGHSTGDRVLRAVAENIRRHIRKSDTFARLGGDEFALLLPETEGEEAKALIARLSTDLEADLEKNSWRVTFSVGVVTFAKPPASVDDMVKLTDAVMYSIKTDSKNGVAYQLYGG